MAVRQPFPKSLWERYTLTFMHPGSQAQSLKYMVCQAHLAGNHASEYYQTLYQLDLTEIIGLNNPLCIHNYKTNSLYSLNL